MLNSSLPAALLHRVLAMPAHSIPAGPAHPAALFWLPRGLEKYMETPFLHLGSLPITPWFLVKALVFLFFIGLIARGSRRLFQKRVLPRTSMEPGQQYALARWVEYFVFCIGLIVGLQTSGLNLSSLLVVGGALGVGIGFGLQNIANNFISGLILLVEQPVRVGQIIDIGSMVGEVIRIGARSTSIRTPKNSVIIVPNSDLVTGRVTNWSAGPHRVLVGIKIGVGYDSDPEKVRALLLDLSRANPDALQDPAPSVVFQDFGDSSINFELDVWFPGNVYQAGKYRSALNAAILKAFRQNGIEMPNPQRDLHIRSVDQPFPIRNAGG